MNKKILINSIIGIGILIVIFVVFFSIPANYKNTIKVNTHKLDAFKSKTPIAKVVIFSDLHLFYDYQPKNLDKLIDTINQQDPDIVIFNGDLFDSSTYKADTKINNEIIAKLKNIQPLYGKFAVMGEQDFKVTQARSTLINSDFEILNNKNRSVSVNNQSFNIIGLLDNKTSLDIMKKTSDKTFNFVLAHNPNQVNSLKDFKIDCLVTGHSLGGQYNLPFYGSIFKNIRDISYYKGYNNINGIPVYNSNGIGIYNSNMRFRAPSSIEEFILY